ncbi:Cytochrome P450 monooxygenase yanC [Penicillium rolfsii]|nr:Cytochrome P450 monooxygenase yanC [Penicillium rolfsii]
MTQTLLIAAIITGLLIIAGKKRWQGNYKFPHIVKGHPLFGNTFQMPLRAPEQSKWRIELAREHGEMRIGTRHWVFLNSSRTVRDLLEKRAARYSSRLPMPMVQDTMSGGKRIVLMPYTDTWRQIRKIMHGILNTRQLRRFAGYQDVETRQLLLDYLRQPDMWFRANQRYTKSVIMSVVFGKRMRLDDPNIIPLLRQAERMVAYLQPGASLVDSFPVLAQLPKFLHWWRKKGLEYFEESRRVYAKEVDEIAAALRAGGTAPECFAISFLKETEGTAIDYDQTLFVMGTLMEAGSDTSRMTMSQIIAAAALYPAWVQTAQRHLDRVCGHGARLPSFDDRDELQYISAAVKEGLRWRPFVPLGVPHMLTEDDEYEGYRFPAGTVFTWNGAAISQSAKEYNEPERFMPERFLNADVENVLQGHWAFGPGRRVCVGNKVAETNLWLALARLLYCFDIQADPNHPIPIEDVEWATFEKAPFAVQIKPRSDAHRQLILQECSTADISRVK